MEELYLDDDIVAALNRDLVGNELAGAPTGFSATTDIDHLGEEAIFVTLDFPMDSQTLEPAQIRMALGIARSAIDDANDRRVYLRFNYEKRLVA